MVAVRPDVDLSFINNQRFRSSRNKPLNSFRLLFGIESVMGIQRLSIVRGVVDPPSVISELYSIALTCIVLYYSLPHLVLLLKSQTVTEAKSLGLLTFIIYRIILLLMHFMVVLKMVFVERSNTVALLKILRDVDYEMNIPANHRLYKSISLRNIAILVAVTVFYVILAITLTRVGFSSIDDLHLISFMALSELELMLCGSLLGCIQLRMRHITAHIKHHFSLPPEESNRNISLIMLNWVAHDIDLDTATFEPTLDTVNKLYKNLLKAFYLINSLFNLQVLFFLLINFASILISLYVFVKISQSKTAILELNIAIFCWWVKMAISICFPCFYAEGVTIAIEEFQSVLLALLGDFRHREHREEVASLLRYCELSQPRFTVFNLFSMDINLPFNYITLVVTYLIVLLQFNLV